MAVLDRRELEASPLADLHAIAREMGIDGYRLLTREELIDAILAGGTLTARDLRERAAAVREDELEELETSTPRRRRGHRQERPAEAAGLKGGEVVEGRIALRPRGGAELVVERAGRSYKVLVAPSQVKRCELKEGDRVAGPIRRRQGQGFALVRVERINGVPAEQAVGKPAPKERVRRKGPAFPERLLELGRDDPLFSEVEALAPIGLGSRAVIVGGERAGKSELLQRIAKALKRRRELNLTVALVGVRPEELPPWEAAGVPLAARLTFAESAQKRLEALQGVFQAAERVVGKGGHGVVLVDTLDGLPGEECQRLLARARNQGNGSLTVIATARAPLGGETTVVALQGDGRLAVDPARSGTTKVELLVGAQKAALIARERERRLGRRRSLWSRLFGG